MRTSYVLSRFTEIDGAINKAKAVADSIGDLEVQAFFARYIVVFASGIYEDCIEHLFTEFAKKYGNQGIALFFSKMLESHFRNPDYNNIKGLLRQINPDYGDELDNKLGESPGSKDAIESVVNNKNAVAHGKPATATLRDVDKYHQQIVPIFEAIEDILDI